MRLKVNPKEDNAAQPARGASPESSTDTVRASREETMPLFAYFPTPAFSAKLARIEKNDPPGHARILGVIERLLENPADADGWMHGGHHGRLKKYVGRRDYRLIYHWCQRCRKEGRKLEQQCGFCNQIQDNSVVFFDVYHKNGAGRITSR